MVATGPMPAVDDRSGVVADLAGVRASVGHGVQMVAARVRGGRVRPAGPMDHNGMPAAMAHDRRVRRVVAAAGGGDMAA